MVGRYAQQVSSRITVWRVGHIIYRASHVKLPTCWFITKPKQHKALSSSCLGWQVTLAFKKKSKTKHRKKLRSPPPKTKESNNKKNPSPKPRNLHHNPEKKSHILAEISNREIILQNIGSMVNLKNSFLEAYGWMKGRTSEISKQLTRYIINWNKYTQ